MFERLLVPLDGSKLAEDVLPLAAKLALAFNGTIILYSVSRAPYIPTDSTDMTNADMFFDLGDQVQEESKNY